MLEAGEVKQRHTAALLVMTVLVTLTFLLPYGMLSMAQLDPELVNDAGRQRMLSQKVALHVNELVTAAEPELARHALGAALQRMRDDHEKLAGTAESPTLTQVYRDGDNALERRVGAFLAAGEALVETSRTRRLTTTMPSR